MTDPDQLKRKFGSTCRRRKAPWKTKQPIGQALVWLIRHCFPWFWEALQVIEFPREPLAHLLDALYCNAPTFKSIARLKQKFICGFLPGGIPTLYKDALTLQALSPHHRMTQNFGPKARRQVRVYTWVNDPLEYQNQRLDFVMCRETLGDKTTAFAFRTNFSADRENVMKIANRGRLRWTIENEGFNVKKTGYELEHFCDCTKLEVMLALYLLLQIAHLLMQLLARSDLLEPVTNLTFLAVLLLEALRNLPLPEELSGPDLPRIPAIPCCTADRERRVP